MKLRYNYRIYPTDEQRKALAQTFGCVRVVYNWGLNLRSTGYKNGERITYAKSSEKLTEYKKQEDRKWLNDVSCVPLQQALRNLQTAFVNFFEKRADYPTFKKKGGAQSAEYTKSAFSFDPATRTLTLAKIGKMKVKWSSKLPSDPTTITIKKNPTGQYFASFVVEVPDQTLPKTGESIGIDFGVARLATLSNGERVQNPKNTYKYAKKLSTLQRRLAKKQKGSKRRLKAKLAVAKVHQKIADCRKDAINKFTTDIIKRFDTIYIEDLNLRGMVKNHNLAKSLSDAGIGMAVQQLEYKATRYGRTVQKIDRWFPSSKLCSKCGHLLSSLSLSVREWVCPGCGAIHDRDENAAANIKAVGQTVSAHGAGVRAVSPSGGKANLRRSANLQRGSSPAGIPHLKVGEDVKTRLERARNYVEEAGRLKEAQ